jgi:hypothetical protein
MLSAALSERKATWEAALLPFGIALPVLWASLWAYGAANIFQLAI